VTLAGIWYSTNMAFYQRLPVLLLDFPATRIGKILASQSLAAPQPDRHPP